MVTSACDDGAATLLMNAKLTHSNAAARGSHCPSLCSQVKRHFATDGPTKRD
jgi:hypothetical protein